MFYGGAAKRQSAVVSLFADVFGGVVPSGFFLIFRDFFGQVREESGVVCGGARNGDEVGAA